MRRVFKGGAVLALIAILAVPALYADDPPPLNDPLDVRIKPPGGLTSAAPAPEPPGVRITPPIGVTSAAPAPESTVPARPPAPLKSLQIHPPAEIEFHAFFFE
jgi:hypothetical protein